MQMERPCGARPQRAVLRWMLQRERAACGLAHPARRPLGTQCGLPPGCAAQPLGSPTVCCRAAKRSAPAWPWPCRAGPPGAARPSASAPRKAPPPPCMCAPTGGATAAEPLADHPRRPRRPVCCKACARPPPSLPCYPCVASAVKTLSLHKALPHRVRGVMDALSVSTCRGPGTSYHSLALSALCGSPSPILWVWLEGDMWRRCVGGDWTSAGWCRGMQRPPVCWHSS